MQYKGQHDTLNKLWIFNNYFGLVLRAQNDFYVIMITIGNFGAQTIGLLFTLTAIFTLWKVFVMFKKYPNMK